MKMTSSSTYKTLTTVIFLLNTFSPIIFLSVNLSSSKFASLKFSWWKFYHGKVSPCGNLWRRIYSALNIRCTKVTDSKFLLCESFTVRNICRMKLNLPEMWNVQHLFHFASNLCSLQCKDYLSIYVRRKSKLLIQSNLYNIYIQEYRTLK